MRAFPVSERWAQAVDDQLVQIITDMTRGNGRLDASQRAQLFLKNKDAGLAMGSAALRRESAFVGA